MSGLQINTMSCNMKRSSHAIEDWAKEVEKAEFREMTEHEAKMFLTCFMNENRMKDDQDLMKILESKDNYASVLWNRLKLHTVEVSPVACIFLESLIFNFGISTMIANYLQYVAHKHQIKKIGMNEIGMNVFPNGSPTDKAWKELWEMQKADDGGNILDDAACGESIRIIE